MGIKGLKTYIIERSDKFLKAFKLHNSYLVIDGNCLISKFYMSNHCNFCFGGEYYDYAYYVSEFFDELTKCNVTPLVIFDGGFEEKKAETVYDRAREKIESVATYLPQYGNQPPIIPLLASNVFRYVLKQKGVKYVRTLFEADNEIAAIARTLNCPVLSDDSDFFIFDVMYIPYDTIKSKASKNLSDFFVMHCKLFKSENISEVFFGFDKKVLPLMAALLGNDYLNSSKIHVFEKFFSALPMPANLSKSKSRIYSVFNWLRNKSIDKAITQVLTKIEAEDRFYVIKMIEMVINGYLMMTPKTLDYLKINTKMSTAPNEVYEYNNRMYYANLDKNCDNISTLAENFENKPLIIKYLKGIPSCVLQKYQEAQYPAFFMDIWTRNPYINSEQIEDISFPSTCIISKKIMKVTFKILKSNSTDEPNCIVQFIARGNGTDIDTNDLNCSNVHIQESIIPTLKDLANLSDVEKVNILTSTLEVSMELLTAFLPSWRLYVSVIKFWLDEADSMFVTKYHFYSLIMSFIYHVVKKVINCERYLNTSVSDEENTKTNHLLSEKMSVHEALKKITKNDCLKVEELFRSYMVIQIKSFNRTVIHSFALFQNCLKQSMYLNDLLDHPFEKVDVAEFFSGVMICNFYYDFIKQKELNTYLMKMLKNSPSVLQLFFSVTAKIRAMLKKNQNA